VWLTAHLVDEEPVNAVLALELVDLKDALLGAVRPVHHPLEYGQPINQECSGKAKFANCSLVYNFNKRAHSRFDVGQDFLRGNISLIFLLCNSFAVKKGFSACNIHFNALSQRPLINLEMGRIKRPMYCRKRKSMVNDRAK